MAPRRNLSHRTNKRSPLLLGFDDPEAIRASMMRRIQAEVASQPSLVSYWKIQDLQAELDADATGTPQPAEDPLEPNIEVGFGKGRANNPIQTDSKDIYKKQKTTEPFVLRLKVQRRPDPAEIWQKGRRAKVLEDLTAQDDEITAWRAENSHLKAERDQLKREQEQRNNAQALLQWASEQMQGLFEAARNHDWQTIANMDTQFDIQRASFMAANNLTDSESEDVQTTTPKYDKDI